LSDLVEIDDLGLLDGHDLRAVFSQVSVPQLMEALSGTEPTLRAQLLRKLPTTQASRLAAEIDVCGAVDPAAVQLAQGAVVAALCRLSRCGQVAFDIPGDMVA
jgi:flagellar motor switch protein FliG